MCIDALTQSEYVSERHCKMPSRRPGPLPSWIHDVSVQSGHYSPRGFGQEVEFGTLELWSLLKFSRAVPPSKKKLEALSLDIVEKL